MKLEPAQQSIIDELIRDTHEAAGSEVVTRDVASSLVAELIALEGSGKEWVADYIHDLMVVGAQKIYSDWRRRYTVQSATKSGQVVDLPGFAGATDTSESGEVIYVQLRFEDMSVAQLEQVIESRSKQRDTLSVEIQSYVLIAELMRNKGLATVRDALELMRAA